MEEQQKVPHVPLIGGRHKPNAVGLAHQRSNAMNMQN